MGIKEWIVPQEKKFFDMLDQQALKIQEGVAALQDLFQDYNGVVQKRQRLKGIENEADDLVHKIFDELNKTFITPIDREDISHLASRLDDIMDSAYAAANRFYLYNIEKPSPEMIEFSNLLVKLMEQIVQAMDKIRNPSDSAEIKKYCVEIHRLENVADEVLNNAFSNLFKGTDAIQVIKHKDIIENLEAATDRCEDVAVIIENIMLKHG